MNTNRFFCLLFSLTIALLQAPRMAAQNDRSIALNNVPQLVQNLADTKPLRRQVDKTYSAPDFQKYDAVVDHIQGLARLPDGRCVFSHSTKPSQTQGLLAFSRPHETAVFRSFGWEGHDQTHPSAMQACGNIVAVPLGDDHVSTPTSIHFFDATDPNNPIELTHLRITSFASSEPWNELNDGIDAVGLVYHEADQKHYLTISKGSEQGRTDGPVWLFESNKLPLTDPLCRFSYTGSKRFFKAFTSASGFNLLYDASGDIYAAALYRTSPGATERVRLSRIFIEADSTYAHEVADIKLSESGIDISPSPGFRWGGTIVPTSSNSLEVIASARVLTGGAGADYCVLKIWGGESILEDCRKYSEVSWLTSHNAFAAPAYGYPAINNQSIDLAGQLLAGARAFTLGAWDKASLNAPSAGAAYNNLRDAMEDGKVYVLNNPRRLKSNGDCCEGINLQGTAWPEDLGENLDKAKFATWLNDIGYWLAYHPTEVVTLFLEGNASYESQLSTLQSIDPPVISLMMNQSDYDNLQNLTLGELRSSNRRLAIFHKGGTQNFTVNGHSFQFRSQFEKTVENKDDLLPLGLNNCDQRDESDAMTTPDRLVVFNHLSQPYHELIVRRWLDHCTQVGIPNFLVVNNVSDGSLGIQPEDATQEFNRRFTEQAVGSSRTYRILVAGSAWNITQESDATDARALISDNPAEWELIPNADRTYFIRLKGTNRYLTAPANILNACKMDTDTDTDRARWYVEPLNGGTVRLFSQHSYAGTRKAMRLADNNLIKLSDNIDFADVTDQKFQLVPVVTLSSSCHSATVELDENGGGSLLPEAVRQQIAYTGVCEAELYLTLDNEYFSCAHLGTQVLTFTASDGAGLSSSCTALVTVVDNLEPTVTCKNKTLYLDANGTANLTSSDVLASSADNCGATLPVSVLPNAFTCNHLGTNTVTLTVSDGHNHTQTCNATVTIADAMAPTIFCPGPLARNTDLNQCSATLSYAVTAADNCAYTLTRTSGLASDSAFPKGANVVYWKVTDAAGNAATCSFAVTVTDHQPPGISCPPNTARTTDPGQCTATVPYASPNYSDNCTGASLTRVSPLGTESGAAFPTGSTSVVWQVTDGAGLTQRCTFTVTVSDGQAPVMACPGNQTKATDANACTAVATYANPSFTDNCAGGWVSIVSGPASGSAFPKGSTTVTWKATDAAGLTKTCTFRVTVNDMQSPAMTCPPHQVKTTETNLCTATATYANATFSDNCTGGSVLKISGLSSGSAFPKGVNNVIFRATDAAGNTSLCTMTVTVNDVQPPAIVCPAGISVTAAAGECSAVAFYPNPTATDNCATQSLYLLSGLSSGAVFPQGVTTNTWKATDDSGGTATCAFTVTVACGTSAQGGSQTFQVSKTWKASGRDLHLTLAPNPATAQVLIAVEGLSERGGTLSIFNATGRRMWHQPVAAWQEQVAMDLGDDWSAGVYMVVLQTGDQVVTQRLAVSRL